MTIQQEKDEARQSKLIVEHKPKYVQKKKRLAPYNPNDTFEDYKARKEASHDKSVQYHKHVSNAVAEASELAEPEGVQYLW